MGVSKRWASVEILTAARRPFLRPESRRACAAGPRPTSPREGAIAVSPAERRREMLRHKVPKTNAGAPTRGRARPYVGMRKTVAQDTTRDYFQSRVGFILTLSARREMICK